MALVEANELARALGVSRAFVYEHADELGVIRLGSGPKARQRYDVVVALERLTACRAARESVREEAASPVAFRHRRRSAKGTGVDLLPIGGVRQRSRAA